MRQPLTIPPLTDDQLADLRQRYQVTDDATLRLRYQIVRRAHQRRSVAEIASIVRRSRDTGARVLKRFLAGGLDALPRDYPAGMTPTVTPEWETELLRVSALDPHSVGVPSANWTTALLATSMNQATGIALSASVWSGGISSLDAPLTAPTQTVTP